MSTRPFSRPADVEPGRRVRPLTGRRVLTYVLAFFLVIIAVNGLMATIASVTFRGIVADNGYVESLRFAEFEKHGASVFDPPEGAADADATDDQAGDDDGVARR